MRVYLQLYRRYGATNCLCQARIERMLHDCCSPGSACCIPQDVRQLQHSRNSYLVIRHIDIAEDLHSSASVIESCEKAKAQAQCFLAMAAYAEPSENRSQHTSAKSCMLLVLLIACLSACTFCSPLPRSAACSPACCGGLFGRLPGGLFFCLI